MEEEIQRYLGEVIYDFRDYSFIARYASNSQDSEFVRDLDRSYGLGPAATGLFESNSFFRNEDTSWEFRVQSPGDQRVRWQLGYYYYNFKEDRFQRDFTGFSRTVMSDTGKQEVTNNAVFGGIEVDIVDNWRVALEGRYAEDEITRLSGPFDDPVTMVETRSVANETFYSFSPRFTLSWFVNPTLTTYFQVAEGNKPGGFNFAYFDVGVDPIELDSDKPFIDEEEATTWEIGAKGSYLDGKLSANVALFYIDWTNQAINTSVCIEELPPPAGAGFCEQNSIVVNAGESEVYGAEVELAWAPIDRLSFTLGYGYADAKLEQFVDEEFAELQCPESCYEVNPATGQSTQAALDEIALLGDVAGNKAPRVPEHNVAASAVWQAPIPGAGSIEWFLRNDFLYESKRYNTTSNLTWAPSQFTWNARLGLESEKWLVSLYVNNLTDEDSAIQIQDFPLFDASQGYTVTGSPTMPPPPMGAPINQNAFSILPRRTRNAGVTAQFRFGS
jgi:outer membrane receptor protein involved in Fe transport